GFLALFVMLLVAVTSGALGPRSVDGRIVSSAHRLALGHHQVLRVARDVTVAGSPLVVDLVAAAIVVGLWILGRRRAAAFVGGVRVVVWLADAVVKVAVGRHRPTLPMPVAHAAGASFPSGHSAGAASVYLPVALILVGAV